MKPGGTGGAKTTSGKIWETKSNPIKQFYDKGFQIKDHEIYKNQELYCLYYYQDTLRTIYLREKGIDMYNSVSAKLKPDVCLIKRNNCLIIEQKFQKIAGSVDEKFASIDFKLKQYRKIFKETDIKNINIWFLVNRSWFVHTRYTDVFTYVRDQGGQVYFDKIPIKDMTDFLEHS